MTDFRALCAELHAAFNTYAVDMAHHNLLERARVALAEQPVVLMDKLDRLIALDRDDPANSLPTSKK